MNCLLKNVVICIFFFIATTSCWDQNSNDPLATHIIGKWRWTKNMDENYKVIEHASAGNEAYFENISLPYGSGFSVALMFYENGIKVDSLYMPDTDNYRSTIQRGTHEILVNYVDAQKNPVVARFKFFFPKNKMSPSKMELNIQKNTSQYKPEADTVIAQYIREVM